MKRIRLQGASARAFLRIRDMFFCGVHGFTLSGAIVLLLAFAVCMGRMDTVMVQAEESGYPEDAEKENDPDDIDYSDNLNDASADAASVDDSADGILPEDTFEETPDPADGGTEYQEAAGSYTMEEGWSLDETQSTDDVSVFVQDACADMAETSTISCSYLSTNYSRQEYEQLRDMLTNNLLYSNVNAQITTSAVYTLSMDYLYIILVDDSSEDYRDIYHYVVGDYQCFCVQVREYRDEAEQAELQDLETPQEAGQKVAEGFTW